MAYSVLPFSRIKEGNRVFGVIKQVNEFELVVSLPNHHTAFVSCNRISKHLESVFKNFAENADSDVDDATKGNDNTTPPTLKEFYKIGDGVVGTIVAVQGSHLPGRDASKRKRLELSLVPAQINSDILPEDLEEGTILPVEIKSIEDKGYVVDLGIKGKQELMGFLSFGDQQETLRIGCVVACRITSLPKKGSTRVISLVLAGNEPTGSDILKNFNSFRPGTILENVEVKNIKDGILSVVVNGIHNGEIDTFNLPLSSTFLNPNPKNTSFSGMAGNYHIGMKIPLSRVVFADCHVGADEKALILSALPSVLASDKLRRELESMTNESVTIGTSFDQARIVRIDPGLGVILNLNSSENASSANYAQVHISRLSDEKITKISSPYRMSSIHPCRIIDYDPFAAISIASMAPSTLSQQFLSIDSIQVGSVVRGEVTTITPGLGILVKLSERIRALCPIAQLTETQSQDAFKLYRLGQKFKFKVLSTDSAARRVMLTRKKGLMESELKSLCDYESAVIGEFYDGYVASIRPFGCIVRFYGDVKAILPLSEINEEFIKDAKEAVFEGQVVRCRVIRVDRETKSMAVSMRKSDTMKIGSKRKTSEVIGQNKEKSKNDSKKEKSKKVKVTIQEKSDEMTSSLSANSPDSVPESELIVPSPPATPVVKVKAVLPSLRQLEDEEMVREEMMTSSNDSLSHKETPLPSSEDLLSMKEMCEEFERRLLGSPNSSLLWIQYISVLIKSMEIDAARSLANRALQTISIRSEAEKLNIWIALMNLEHSFGTPENLKAVFDRACVYSDTKAVHLALARIYEESADLNKAESLKLVEDFYSQNLLKKFRQSCKVWMNLVYYYFVTKKTPASARKLLAQALEALPRHKHIKATLKFAQMEFRHGCPDRGRTLFEGVIASSPSRLDIWGQYCDQEERHLPDSIDNLRRLYTRIIHLKLSSKKAKFFFKKFLEFEKKYGDQLTVQNVKDLAQKYVESSIRKD